MKDAILWTRIKEIRAELSTCASSDYDRALSLMARIRDLETMRSGLAKLIGDRVIAPKK